MLAIKQLVHLAVAPAVNLIQSALSIHAHTIEAPMIIVRPLALALLLLTASVTHAQSTKKPLPTANIVWRIASNQE